MKEVGWLVGCTSKKHEAYWQSICGQRQAKGFLKRPSAKRAGELLNLSRDQLKIMMGLLTGHCHLKGDVLTLGLVDSPGCELKVRAAGYLSKELHIGWEIVEVQGSLYCLSSCIVLCTI